MYTSLFLIEFMIVSTEYAYKYPLIHIFNSLYFNIQIANSRKQNRYFNMQIKSRWFMFVNSCI